MEHLDNQYETLSEAVADLEKQGYTDELTLRPEGLFNVEMPLDPTEFAIDSFHRFEGPSDPGDMSIVYAISSTANDLKGLLVGSYGPESLNHINKMVQPLATHKPEGRTHPVAPAPPESNVKY